MSNQDRGGTSSQTSLLNGYANMNHSSPVKKRSTSTLGSGRVGVINPNPVPGMVGGASTNVADSNTMSAVNNEVGPSVISSKQTCNASRNA